MAAEAPDEVFRDGQRGLEDELLTLQRILEGKTALSGGGMILRRALSSPARAAAVTGPACHG
jgi:hypothetical protein